MAFAGAAHAATSFLDTTGFAGLAIDDSFTTDWGPNIANSAEITFDSGIDTVANVYSNNYTSAPAGNPDYLPAGPVSYFYPQNSGGSATTNSTSSFTISFTTPLQLSLIHI